MRITMIAVGTRGDVQPMLALASGFRAAGHQVRFATEASYAHSVAAAGIEYHALSGESQSFSAARAASMFRDTIERPATRYKRFWNAYVVPTARQHLRESVEPCAQADLLICQPWFGIGPSLGEKFRIPVVIAGVFPVPALPTREFPFPLYAGARADLSHSENWRSWRRALSVIGVSHRTLQEWRRDVLGLQEQSLSASLASTRATPHILGYSSAVLPKPIEWDANVEVTGYWFVEPSLDYRPPAELDRFLRTGPPPVVVGFGSHVGRNPARLTQLVVEALRSAGQRGLVITGWGGLQGSPASPDIHFAEQVPYDWLLPRAQALVHHGGAGTTSIALRMGKPQVITAFGWDQSFWGYRIAKLGVGVAPLAAKTLSVEALASALREAVSSSALHNRAREVAELIGRERGVEAAVAAATRFAERAALA